MNARGRWGRGKLPCAEDPFHMSTTSNSAVSFSSAHNEHNDLGVMQELIG